MDRPKKRAAEDWKYLCSSDRDLARLTGPSIAGDSARQKRRKTMRTGAFVVATCGSLATSIVSASAGPIHDAVKGGDASQVEQLASTVGDINEKDLLDKTALHYAAEAGRADLVQLLVENGADVNAMDFDNQAALSYAVWDAYEEVVALLVASGADVNLLNANDERVLDDAIRRGRQSIAEILIEAGAVCGTNHIYSTPCNEKMSGSN